jgi:Membrane-bound lytic murein transglycosylase B
MADRQDGRYPNISWCVATGLLVCITIFVLAGEYRAQSTTPHQDVLYDSMLRSSASGNLISRSIVPDVVSTSSTDLDIGNSTSQRLGHELQALLWTMTAERTVVSPKTAAPPVTASPVEEKKLPDVSSIDPAWKPLIARLIKDGFNQNTVLSMYASLGAKSYSPAFMAAKIHELYGVQGVGIRRTATALLPDNYTQPISDTTLGSSIRFMKKYAPILNDIEKKHGVPADVIVGLLLIETGLGSDLGNNSAFRALSSMAVTSNDKMLSSAGNGKQVSSVRAGSLAATLRDKSNWAYKEVKALIKYSRKNNLDIATIPGSIYGAIGICQFMPSNIVPFAKDGDKDGKVNVFNIVDAMYSVANYLESNGWRGARNEAARLSVIRTYNNDTSYAASVLGTSNQLALAQQGKISHRRHAVASVERPRASQVFLDPSLKNLKPVPENAKVHSLAGYHALY